ncbi:MAG: acyl-CoA thioesterase [Candidatus Thiodiazotropha sp. (ex Semelilucina semeliformis)]|nr:acyl-CoA thioesterase [Candidatus Thiodiazotropha sp. (ex Myrtea spinifera)]MCU7808249.1 acyl-CoA thioesterase [Candidatus Thiodiazotropha sp. (ex Semelilucina semeliformis)]MCU7828834.1 acyl-CoA thioesterase [Candidatus Thiodiazotropha sp. (ex Myrtea sp. 'scaly one' KF741663)]
MQQKPTGELMTRILAMPADANPSGDIFGGWVMSQMDLAAGICAGMRANGRVVTVAVNSMSFIQPVKVGDILCVYTGIVRVGRTSMEIHVEAWAKRQRIGDRDKVTEAKFAFVALDNDGKPKVIPPEGATID